MDASTILTAIGNRHTKDLFVPECKDGPTWGGPHLRLDAWAIRRSWTKPQMTGYEIKVSRADWLNDDKSHLYLSLCNVMWLVSPSGVILPEEVPVGVGLLYISKTGSRLFTKKKAPYREVEFPETLIRYILHSRVRTTNLRYSNYDSREDRLRRWLARDKEKKELGVDVTSAIRERVTKIEIENHRLLKAVEKYEKLKEWLDINDFNILDYRLEDAIRDAAKGVSEHQVREVERAISALEAARDTLKGIRNRAAPEAGKEETDER